MNINLEPSHRPSSFFSRADIRMGDLKELAFKTVSAALAALAAGSLAAAVSLASPAAFGAAAVSGLSLAALLGYRFARSRKEELPPPLRSFVDKVKVLTNETFAHFAFTAFKCLNFCWKGRRCTVVPGEVPVLMIHGYCHNSSGWLYHRYRLEKEGVHNLYTMDLGHPFQSIEQYGEKVRQKVFEIRNETGCSDLRLVGHSMGGLVSAHYAVVHAPLDGIRVKDVVTLGSPLNGTKMSSLGLGKCARQMGYGSPFVKGLQEKIKRSDVPFIHLMSHRDQVIRPCSSASLEGENHRIVKFDDMGHLSYLLSDRVNAILCAQLRT